MKNYFKDYNEKIALTSDVWNAPHSLRVSYICITCHWIDPTTWQMMKRTIDYQKFLYPHDGSNLYTVIMQCVRDYSLKDKIINISFDNASNNTNCARRLKNTLKPMLDGKFLHT